MEWRHSAALSRPSTPPVRPRLAAALGPELLLASPDPDSPLADPPLAPQASSGLLRRKAIDTTTPPRPLLAFADPPSLARPLPLLVRRTRPPAVPHRLDTCARSSSPREAQHLHLVDDRRPPRLARPLDHLPADPSRPPLDPGQPLAPSLGPASVPSPPRAGQHVGPAPPDDAPCARSPLEPVHLAPHGPRDPAAVAPRLGHEQHRRARGLARARPAAPRLHRPLDPAAADRPPRGVRPRAQQPVCRARQAPPRRRVLGVRRRDEGAAGPRGVRARGARAVRGGAGGREEGGRRHEERDVHGDEVRHRGGRRCAEDAQRQRGGHARASLLSLSSSSSSSRPAL